MEEKHAECEETLRAVLMLLDATDGDDDDNTIQSDRTTVMIRATLRKCLKIFDDDEPFNDTCMQLFRELRDQLRSRGLRVYNRSESFDVHERGRMYEIRERRREDYFDKVLRIQKERFQNSLGVTGGSSSPSSRGSQCSSP